MHIQSPGMVRTVCFNIFKEFRHIQEYWCIFSHTHRHETRGEWGDFPCLFWNRKKCPDFGKKDPDCVHLRVKFAIENVVLRVSRRKTSKMFPCRVSFSCAFDECLLKCPSSTNPLPPCPEKVLIVHLHSGIVPFAKRSILNVWQCSEYVCLDNCSVICIATLYYVLYQTHSEFWHIHHFVFFRYMLGCSIIFSIIRAYSCILRHY